MHISSWLHISILDCLHKLYNFYYLDLKSQRVTSGRILAHQTAQGAHPSGGHHCHLSAG